jgi:hypothetical protein
MHYDRYCECCHEWCGEILNCIILSINPRIDLQIDQLWERRVLLYPSSQKGEFKFRLNGGHTDGFTRSRAGRNCGCAIAWVDVAEPNWSFGAWVKINHVRSVVNEKNFVNRFMKNNFNKRIFISLNEQVC